MAVMDRFVVNQCLGPSFDGFDYLPVLGTRGGILIAWNTAVVQITNVAKDSFAISGQVSSTNGEPWWITVVYGPQSTEKKIQFLAELSLRRAQCLGAWLFIGDFNMILRASEKNNENLDRASMRRFRDFVNEQELKECYMHGRLFTWSNERRSPTMSKIDRALVCVDWDLAFPDSLLQAISSSVSDHAPLHLSMTATLRPKKRFKFETFWLQLEGFDEAVREGWKCGTEITDPFLRLDACYRNLAVHLQAWGDRKIGNLKLQIALANLIIHWFDAAQETRNLSPEEWWLRKTLKHVVLGLSSLERTMARQRSRLRWLKDRDANTKLFHVVANGRRTNNFIPAIRHDGVLIADQNRKEDIFYDYYKGLLGTIQNREYTMDLQLLGLQDHDLSEMVEIFSEEEIWGVIKELPPDRAPSPDGFVGAFYKRAWPVIKGEIMAAMLKLYVGDGRTFGHLNHALITLIPKKPGAEEVGDFRPISLVHSFAKLFPKLLANRLRPRMDSLVSKNQSAFIKGRNLHDNFLLVRQLARKINRRKEPGVLLKLDLTWAFDSLSWSFLFEVLEGLGFPLMFRRWIAIAFRMATTKVAVNGIPGRRITHARGLRQGDPLSPLLFVLSMEVMTALLNMAVDMGMLSPIGNCSATQRISIYIDDVIIFLKPSVQDLVAVREMLSAFGAVSGLHVNYRKTAATLIRARDHDEELVTGLLNCSVTQFPIKYLGLQLALRPLTRAQWQPMLDATVKFLPGW
jgi:hypothetical protein